MARSHRRWILYGAVGLLVLLGVSLRLIALDSDPYSRLSWSSGLLTDEGFYIHNARNVVLFGTARTDEFNNMLIMPTLHFVQVAVFRMWGVGAIQARMISVVCSLLMLAVFFAAARRGFGRQVACLATLFLGLDHITLLYNRMALMDTPGAMLLAGAFYAWVSGTGKQGRAAYTWLFMCGVLLSLAMITRGLDAIVVPVPFLALLWHYRAQWKTQTAGRPAIQESAVSLASEQDKLEEESGLRCGAWLLAGLAFILFAYLVTWYLPHRVELTQVNRYYLWHQLMPHSGQRLALNLLNAWFGDERGMAPFLMRHSPLQVILTGGWFFARRALVMRRRENGQRGRRQELSENFVVLWLLMSLLVMSVVSYSPSRYYVLFTPALALTAAFALVKGREVWLAVVGNAKAVILLGGYAAYHLTLFLFHHQNIRSIVLIGIETVIGAWLTLLISRMIASYLAKRMHLFWALPAIVMALWAGINGFYLTDWLAHLRYGQRDASRWLAANLPPDSVLIGDVAPGVCLDNRFRAVSVITYLCNDISPVEKYRGHPRAIVILDGKMQEARWALRYPELIRPERRIKLFHLVGRFPVGVYLVDERDL